MGFDWEEMLGADGGDMADAYEDAVFTAVRSPAPTPVIDEDFYRGLGHTLDPDDEAAALDDEDLGFLEDPEDPEEYQESDPVTRR